MRITLLMLVLAAMSSGAMAEWVLVSQPDIGTKVYLDPLTIKKDGNLGRAWVLFDFSTANTDGVLSRRTLQEYDCKGERRRTLSISTHSEPMAGGSVLYSATNPNPVPPWSYITPDTGGVTVFKLVCKQ